MRRLRPWLNRCGGAWGSGAWLLLNRCGWTGGGRAWDRGSRDGCDGAWGCRDGGRRNRSWRGCCCGSRGRCFSDRRNVGDGRSCLFSRLFSRFCCHGRGLFRRLCRFARRFGRDVDGAPDHVLGRTETEAERHDAAVVAVVGAVVLLDGVYHIWLLWFIWFTETAWCFSLSSSTKAPYRDLHRRFYTSEGQCLYGHNLAKILEKKIFMIFLSHLSPCLDKCVVIITSAWLSWLVTFSRS